MRQKKKARTVNIRHWKQASFLPKIKYPAAKQVPMPPRVNEGATPTPPPANP